MKVSILRFFIIFELFAVFGSKKLGNNIKILNLKHLENLSKNKTLSNKNYSDDVNNNFHCDDYIEENIKEKSKNYFKYFERITENPKKVTIKEDYNNANIPKNTLFYLGNCLIKYGKLIIDLYPLKKERENFFIKYNNNIIDFNICDNIFTYNGKKGLVANRYDNILFAGDVSKEKYWQVFEKKETKLSSDNKNKDSPTKQDNNSSNNMIELFLIFNLCLMRYSLR